MLVESLIILLDIAFTVLMSLFVIPKGHGYLYWTPFLLLIAGYIISLVFIWIFMSLFCQIYSKKKTYTKPSKLANFLLRHCVGYINIHARVKLNVIQNEPWPKERFLLVCNHLSRFDPMIVIHKYGKLGMAFITKPSNFKIPIGGHFMKAGCYMAIDREDKLKSLEVMKEASRLIEENLASVGVYPEGTRREVEDHVGEFHEGVFSIAMKNNAPIVVTSILGSQNIAKNFPWKSTKVRFEIIIVIYPSEYQGKTLKAVSDYARSLIKESIENGMQ